MASMNIERNKMIDCQKVKVLVVFSFSGNRNLKSLLAKVDEYGKLTSEYTRVFLFMHKASICLYLGAIDDAHISAHIRRFFFRRNRID